MPFYIKILSTEEKNKNNLKHKEDIQSETDPMTYC